MIEKLCLKYLHLQGKLVAHQGNALDSSRRITASANFCCLHQPKSKNFRSRRITQNASFVYKKDNDQKDFEDSIIVGVNLRGVICKVWD